MGKSALVPSPNTGSFCFGVIPELAGLGTVRCPIFLLEGYHSGGGAGRGSGFGVLHIAAAHGQEITRSGRPSVAHYIAQNVFPGVPVCTEGGYSRRERVLAMRMKRTIVALKYRQDRKLGTYWSVITAYVRKNMLPAQQLAVIEACDP